MPEWQLSGRVGNWSAILLGRRFFSPFGVGDPGARLYTSDYVLQNLGTQPQQAIDVGLLAMVNGLVSYPGARVGPRVYIVFNAISITCTADYVL